jgi:hypothetical protein
MSVLSELRVKVVKAWPFQTLPPMDWSAQVPSQANQALIRSALMRAQRRPSGNWYAFAASSQVAAKAWGTSVAGVQIVAWRGVDGGLLVAPRACPHLGADLATAPVKCGTLVCPWHGLRLSDRRHGAWKPLPAHDDGVLCWVRLDAPGGEVPTDAPIPSPRPGDPRLAAVSRLEVFASLAISSPTGWIRGTARGYTRIRSPDSKCSAHLQPMTTSPTSSTTSSLP